MSLDWIEQLLGISGKEYKSILDRQKERRIVIPQAIRIKFETIKQWWRRLYGKV